MPNSIDKVPVPTTSEVVVNAEDAREWAPAKAETAMSYVPTAAPPFAETPTSDNRLVDAAFFGTRLFRRAA